MLIPGCNLAHLRFTRSYLVLRNYDSYYARIWGLLQEPGQEMRLVMNRKSSIEHKKHPNYLIKYVNILSLTNFIAYLTILLTDEFNYFLGRNNFKEANLQIGDEH